MGHFVLNAGSAQVHLYCRDADTYEEILEAAEELGSVLQVRAGQEATIPPSTRRVHLFIRESRVFAVDHEASAHNSSAYKLDEEIADALLKAFPALVITEDGLLPSAPFAAGMLPVLTDF